MPAPSQPRHLNSAQRIFFLLLNIGFGILPSLAFFAWVERNASLPYVGIEWGWPWISLQTWPTAALAAWDFGLFLAFGVIHSLFAQTAVQRALERVFPPQAIRTVFMCVTGASLIALMGFWQNTGVVLWSAPLGFYFNNSLSFVVFWSFMAACGWVMNRFDPFQFVGLRQIYMSSSELARTEGTPQLETGGIYARVRHPIYTFTLLAFLLTPFMTLDRMVVFAATATYLAFAVPVEERKLIALFGPSYEVYRKRVPAVFPRLRA
jgi:protein-S-isoprenylcysteine O-methyltransferase Ste14